MAWWCPKPQFFGVVPRASNIGQKVQRYTAEMFAQDFPQFFRADCAPFLPEAILNEFLSQASEAIQADKWLTGWRFACGLYVAHYATMFLRSFPEEPPQTAAQAAQTGALVGVVRRAQLGDSSVEYDTAAVTEATKDWGDLNATSYGQMLATRARLVGLGGTAVI